MAKWPAAPVEVRCRVKLRLDLLKKKRSECQRLEMKTNHDHLAFTRRVDHAVPLQ